MIRGYRIEIEPGYLYPGSNADRMLADIMMRHSVYGTVDYLQADQVVSKQGFAFEVPAHEAQAFADEFQSNHLLSDYLMLVYSDPIPVYGGGSIDPYYPLHEPYIPPDFAPDLPPAPAPADPRIVDLDPVYVYMPSVELPRGSGWPLFAVAGGGLLLWLYLRRRD